MTSLETASLARLTARILPFARRSTALLFAGTLFVSALLLFAVQPMFTKMVLPRLGGSPSVWSVAMVAFQTFLFIGYVYAHVLTRALGAAARGAGAPRLPGARRRCAASRHRAVASTCRRPTG